MTETPAWLTELTQRAEKEAPNVPAATVQPTRYVVSCIPESVDGRHSFTINVEYRGEQRWAVLDTPYCLNSYGTWDFEHIPSERTDQWIADHRFDLDTALDLARKHAPLMHVNGFTVSDALAMEKKRAERHA